MFPIQDAAEKEAAFKSFIENQGAKGAADVEKLVTLYGSDGFAVGSSLTWADILIYEVITFLLAKNPEMAAQIPKTNAIRDSVAKHQRIIDYVAKRPETPF